MSRKNRDRAGRGTGVVDGVRQATYESVTSGNPKGLRYRSSDVGTGASVSGLFGTLQVTWRQAQHHDATD